MFHRDLSSTIPFILHTCFPIGDIKRKHGLHLQLYAYDDQCYLSFKPDEEGYSEKIVKQVQWKYMNGWLNITICHVLLQCFSWWWNYWLWRYSVVLLGAWAGCLRQNMPSCHLGVWNLYPNTFTGVLYGLLAVAIYIYYIYCNDGKTIISLIGAE